MIACYETQKTVCTVDNSAGTENFFLNSALKAMQIISDWILKMNQSLHTHMYVSSKGKKKFVKFQICKERLSWKCWIHIIIKNTHGLLMI